MTPPRSPDGAGRAPGGLPLAATCGHLLRVAQQRHTAIWAEEIGGEVTGPQYAVLAALEAEPGSDQRRVGDLASLDRSSTTDVVARLAARGWLARTSDPGDGRRDVLTLTPDAGPALRRLHPRVARVQRRLLEPLDPSEHAALVRDLEVVGRVDADATPPGPASPLRIAGHLLRRAQQVHTALFADEFDRDLTGPQYAVLHVLAEHPGISQRELGRHAALDRSTTTDLVRRLERRGWVVRERDAADARRRVLALSDAAREATEEAAPRVAAVQVRLLAPLEAPHRAAFQARLALLAGLPEVERASPQPDPHASSA